MPVVMIDGFDELLQATGVAHYNFLERVQEFQEREADLDRPLAVIVSSRTAVTDRARIPPGATAIRLESFNEEQITAWLEIWARTNRVSLAERNLQSLPADVALNYEELAGQPLLLIMLALYDADSNALQHRPAALGRTSLYGRLFKDFAYREIRRRFGARFEADLENAVEAELLHLSIVAFAMFNRRSQWVRQTDIDGDFRILLVNGSPSAAKTWAKEAQLTAAQLIIGRFFFVNESHATRTYEFLHATFGEFLVARLVVKVLSERRTAGTAEAAWPSGGPDEMLYALLSFEALTARNPIVAFVGDLLGQLDPQHRMDIADMLLRLHTRALFPPTESSYSSYEPLALPATTRHAAWSANLVVLAVLAAGEITGSQLYPLETDPQLAWRAEALIWRSQLGGHGWEGLHETIALNRVWDGRRKEFRLSRNDGTFMPEALDMSWTFDVPPDSVVHKEIFSSPPHNSFMTQRKINFVSNMSEDIMAHDLAPLVSSFPATAHIFVVLSDERVVSAVHALISALGAPYQEGPLSESVYLDLAQVTRKLMEASNVAQDASYLKMALGVLISAVQQGILSLESAQLIAGLISNITTEDTRLTELLARLDSLLSEL